MKRGVSRVQRADWAASVPWIGITGKPTGADGGTNTVTKETIIRETPAKDNQNPLPNSVGFYWEPGVIRPLETVTKDFTVATVKPGNQIIVGTPYAFAYGQISAVAPGFGTVRLSLTNMGLDAVTLAGGYWRFRVLP